MRPLLHAACLAAIIACLSQSQVHAQSPRSGAGKETNEQAVERFNSGTIGIVSGGIDGTYVRIASDLATVLDNGEELRILPVIGKGSVQNIADILYLKGVDVGIVQSDVLSYLRRKDAHRDIHQRIQYIAKLYNEEFHLVAASAIKSIEDLAGKKVNVGIEGSGSEITATTVFAALSIKVDAVHHDQALALQKIKQGEIAATVFVTGKPARAMADLKAGDGLQLLPVPFTEPLQDIYLPAVLTAEDYPRLVREGAVGTIAVGAVMAVLAARPESENYKRLTRFTSAFFGSMQAFQAPPRHPKWREVSLAAEVPGWIRFAPAAAWLAVHNVVDGSPAGLKASFSSFLDDRPPRVGGPPLSKIQQEALFQAFQRWQQHNR